MPFKKEFDNTYKLGIRTAVEELGAYCERVDEQEFEGRILENSMISLHPFRAQHG